jgi:hypothetical protein
MRANVRVTTPPHRDRHAGRTGSGGYAFVDAYNFARRLKTLSGLTPYEFICKAWTSEPHRFKISPLQQMPGLNRWVARRQVSPTSLWSAMADRFRAIEAILEDSAPMTAALTRRVVALPPLAELAAKAQQDYDDAYCGGQIKASLRKVLGA